MGRYIRYSLLYLACRDFGSLCQIREAFIRRVPFWFDWSLIGAVGLLSFLVPRSRKGRVVICTILLLALYGGAAFFYFQRTLTWLPALLPLGLALFVMLYRLVTPDWATKPKRPVLM